jgi:peptidoglycan/LPS O-acetylase OafA/YrhL
MDGCGQAAERASSGKGLKKRHKDIQITSTTSGRTLSERLHGLDAARSFSMMLGVFAHATLEYARLSTSVDTAGRSYLAGLFFFFSYSFRMEAFLLLSGFFARLLYTRRGPKTFVLNRVKRIVVPLLVMLVPVNLAMNALQYRTGGGFVAHGLWPLRPEYLWFLYYLVFFLGTAIIMTRLPKMNLRFLDSLVSYAAPFALAIPTALVLRATGGSTTPVSFVPDLLLLLNFGFFFMIGWLFHSREGLIGRLAHGTLLRFGLALVAFVVMLVLVVSGGRFGEPAVWAGHYARGVFAWYMTFAFIGFFLRFFQRPGKVVGYLADASYWTYLIMFPIVIFIQRQLRPWVVPIGLKYLISVALTFIVCLASYHFLVRSTVVGRVLNGRRAAKLG